MAPIHQSVEDDDEQYSSEEESTGDEENEDDNEFANGDDDEELEDKKYHSAVVVEDASESDEEEDDDDDDEEEQGVSEEFHDEPIAHNEGIRVESDKLEDEKEDEEAESENEQENEEESEEIDSEEDEDEDSEDDDNEQKALFDDERGDETPDEEEEAAKRRQTLMILACCCCCLAIVAIVLVILLVTGGNKKDPKTTSTPTATPSLIPTISPTMPRTLSPTVTPGLSAVSDTYLRSGNFADTDFGTSESIQILDGDGDGFQAIILLLFNISAMVGEVDNIFDQTNFYLRLFHVESVNDEISDISVLRLPYTDSLQVESLTWNTFTAPTEGVITGTTFVIEEDSQMLNVDITNLLSTTGRRLRGYTAEEVGDVNMLFLQLQATNNTDLFGELFRSREYLNGTEAPQIVTSILQAPASVPSVSRPTNMPSMSKQPTDTPKPSTSKQPTATPTRSLSPTITPQPSHSMAPSVAPSVSVQPSESPTDRITCDDEPAPCGTNAYCVETIGTDVVYCECGDFSRVAFGEACTDEQSGMTKQPTATPTNSQSPTITPHPSLSMAPSVAPSVSFQPSHSKAPTVAPTVSVKPSESPTDRITCDDEPAPCGDNANCIETTGMDVVYCECGDLTRVAFGQACTDEQSGIGTQPTSTPTQSLNPTITPQPTLSMAPTVAPSVSFQPSHSMAPSVAPSVSIQPSESPTDRITCDDEPAPCGANAFCVETIGTDVVYCECGDMTRVAFGEACTDEHSGTTLCVEGTCTGEGAQCEEIFSSAQVAIGIECVCEDETLVGNDEACNVTNSTRW